MSQSGIIPSKNSFDIVLTKTITGKTVIETPICAFSYTWDFNTNMGQASLDAINNTKLGIVLHPTGIAGMLAFMSDMKPTGYQIGGQQVILNRIVLMIDAVTGEHRAGIMFNEDGSTIEVSANWQNEHNTLVVSMIRKAEPQLFR